MAEAVGLVASTAGLLSLAGQLLQRCLYLKDIFDNAKDAPANIWALSTKVEILFLATRHIAKIIRQTVQSGVTIVEAEYEPALRQCVRIVESLRKQLAQTSKKFLDDGGLKWWDTIKVACV
jgi:outer membrane PBP1 activator LpoA protein